ncbi:MAG: Phosphoribosyl-ATP pyrophosphatase [Firmicutes bacterium ADurb.Bin080]|jgi:phosphoribosyl-ATP pyrophosphohydrolase|nr:phosphoribosyl-ATP diphosphatase [Clostridiales bacterium]OQC14046.1 MAG: Phosphoribosyl-ATP pyrophosphatase [Firmicutes bacterium ADurb.Bin080]
MDSLEKLEKIINERKNVKSEGSYTCYLFEKGIDKILKKCGEECSEMIIAAKNAKKEEIVLETSDLIYHIMVMLAQMDIPLSEIDKELESRAKKQMNLKEMKNTDLNS